MATASENANHDQETQENEKKRVTRKPQIVQKLEKYAENNNIQKTIRNMNIKCGFRRAVHGSENAKALEKYFLEQANILGTQRCIVSLFSNYLILEKSKDNEYIKFDKTLYDNCWSSMAAFKTGKSTPGSKYLGEFEEFASKTKLKKEHIPQITKFEIRQFLTLGMYTTAKTSLKEMFSKRMFGYVKTRVRKAYCSEFSTLGTDYSSTVFSLTAYIVQCIIQYDNTLNNSCEKLSKFCKDKKIDSKKAMKIVANNRNLLKKCYVFQNEKIKNKNNLYCLVKYNPELFFDYLITISKYNQENRKEYVKVVREAKKLFKTDAEKEKKNEYIKENLEGVIVPNDNFSILPIFKLQPAFVKYNVTVLSEQFPELELVIDRLETNLFNLDHIPQIRRRNKGDKILFTGFQTDGVQLVAELQMLRAEYSIAPNVDNLVKKGYSELSKPSKKINVLECERGVHISSEKRNDLKKIKKSEKTENINLVAIDPGLAKVICVRETKLEKCGDAKSIMENSDSWSISNQEYVNLTSRDEINKQLDKMKKKNKKYCEILDELSNEMKKTTNLENLIGYSSVLFKKFDIIQKEHNKKQRKILKFTSKRKIDSAVHSIANKMFKTTSYKKEDNYKNLSDDEKIDIRKKRKLDIDSKSKTKRVAFFGNGSFTSGGSGYQSMPKKKIVKFLGITGLTFVLDEYNTSKKCPGCGSNMCNTNKKSRVRHCTSEKSWGEPNMCILATEKGNYEDDRDESATISMTSCAYSAITEGKRPIWFCRNQSEQEKEIEKISNNIFENKN